MRVLTHLIFVLCLTCQFLFSEENPVPRLEQTMNAALDLIFSPEYADRSQHERADLVRATVEEQFDLGVLIRRTFGRNWKGMDASYQARLTEQVKELLVFAFVEGMIGKNRPAITFDAPEFLSSKRIEVASKIIVDEQVYQLTYRFGRLQSGWQIYDILAEGISMVANYRQQIDDHFRNDNAQALVKKLDELLND
jgi:phospholipid transport system substrate-binding protein